MPRKIGTKVMDQASSIITVKATNDIFPLFNLERDLEIGQFMAFIVKHKAVKVRVLLSIGKVVEFGPSKWTMKVKVI